MATLASRPSVSSPLARPTSIDGPAYLSTRPQPKRNLSITPVHFPTSRPLRPFPSIAQPLSPLSPTSSRKAIKIIEPPKNFKSEFVLNLTQAEFSRQD
ncbi:uncharacterized protein PHACADRAFT_154721 [Phanerochaete carnosa HHB-10118-sp]|uniref:Uncharacterized protein n=1 Tax=Phanerochaete carnosa (strain HHB-10118-sp) TaxID=650164 RepID=K5VR90_PHACS|nr:uncharacterized protein PHACADRAFT_154721 [Phanerochaete carnosa HHB-10118-sp]EKM49094.1 hypothetical protein PHACADRAFT_154721 [Phanerochaete carnosa HHB-10118-sp]